MKPLIVLLTVLLLIPVATAIPQNIDVQMLLRNTAGALQDITETINVTIFAVSNGTNPLFSQQESVIFDNGIGHLTLNSVGLAFNETYRANATGATLGNLGGFNMTTVPYAFRAKYADILNSYGTYTITSLIASGDVNVTGDVNAANVKATGNVMTGGGYSAGGVTVESDGDIWMDGSLYLTGNLSSVDVTSLNVNGSIYPLFDDVYEIGNGSLRYARATFGTGNSSFDTNVLFIRHRHDEPNGETPSIFWFFWDNLFSFL